MHVQKNWFLIPDKKVKAKSKCSKCLTDRNFFDGLNDECDL